MTFNTTKRKNRKIFKTKNENDNMKKGRKITGGRYIKARKKKLRENQGQKRKIKLGEERRKVKKVRGGNIKVMMYSGKYVNVQIKGKSKRAEIKNVIETPSDKFLARQNIITKGTIVLTDLGKVKVTSRPTQVGIINGILVE